MDAVQVVQIVPAVQAFAGTTNPVPTAADAGGDAKSPLFRMMFEQTATAIASRGTPPHFARGAVVRQDAIQEERREAARPVLQVLEQAAAATSSGTEKTQSEQDPEEIFAALKKELDASANTAPMWVMPEQLPMVNRQPAALMETAVPAVQDGSEPRSAAAQVAVIQSLPSMGMDRRMNVPAGHATNGKEVQTAGDPPHVAEPMLSGETAVLRLAEAGAERNVQQGTGQGETQQAGPAATRSGKVPLEATMKQAPEGIVELKAEVRGESVLRQVTGGMTVANPARTAGKGVVSLPAEALRPEQPIRTESIVAGEQAEQGGEVVAVDAAGDISGGKESFSSWGGSRQRPDAGTGEGSQPFPGHAAGPGTGETSVRGVEEARSGRVSGEEKGHLHQEILSQVRERLESHVQGGGDGRITLRLNPRELGELQLNVRMDDRRMSVEVMAQNPVVKEALLQNLDQLRDTLSRQNIQMERFEVATGTGQQGAGQPFREGRQGAHRHADDIPYSPAGYYREESAAIPAAGWETRENSLVDVRL